MENLWQAIMENPVPASWDSENFPMVLNPRIIDSIDKEVARQAVESSEVITEKI